MGHAAVTRADLHRFSETFARGGVGQAGVEAKPFHAWIDSWDMRGLDGMDAMTSRRLRSTHRARISVTRCGSMPTKPLVLQGDAGYSRKSERGQASYYYSQPFFKADGQLTIDDKPVEVTGLAWMDREWSSQPLALGSDRMGLVLAASGDRRKADAVSVAADPRQHYCSGNWILPDGNPCACLRRHHMTPMATTEIADRKLPTTWRIAIPIAGLTIETARSIQEAGWGRASPIGKDRSASPAPTRGVGYLEMTGY